jgi:hypothetical protein
MSFGASTGLGYPRCPAWIGANRTFSLVVSYGGSSAGTTGQKGVSGAEPLSWSLGGFAGKKSDFSPNMEEPHLHETLRLRPPWDLHVAPLGGRTPERARARTAQGA